MADKARKVRKLVGYSGGLESTIDSVATLLLIATAIVALLLVVITEGLGAFNSAVMVVMALPIWIGLRGLAEMIRLKKKELGLPYNGDISEAEALYAENCSVCNALLHREVVCPSCGKEFEADAEEKSGG